MAAALLAERERRRLALWAPVLLGVGIWAFFAMSAEPSGWLVAAAVALPAAVAAALLTGGRAAAPVAVIALALVATGFASAALRTATVAAPVMDQRLDVTVEGRVHEISRSSSDRRRVALVDLVIYGLPAERTPERVRVTLLEGDFARKLTVGGRISVFAQLGPPEGPVEPGGFDFRRHAWFDGLGGIGFARGPAVAAQPRAGSPSMSERLGRLRGTMTDGIVAALPGREGGFAAAILTGSRAEVHKAELTALRDSNLAHLLAISGLHMGLLAALVFGVVRFGLAAVPPLALRLPSKKVAAGAALAAAAAYLALSGASVATQRAFVMAATALIAVMLDRPAISLRALAVAALVILLLRPESLFNAGFQMSFAATAALIAVYEQVRERDLIGLGERPWLRRVAVFLFALTLTSVVAGLATAPWSAASFNRMSNYGLLANLAAVPVMGFWVAPFGALAAALAPLGLHEPPLWAMGRGIAVILCVAEAVASLPGAVRPVAQPPAAVMPMIVFGGLWLVVWRTRLRLAGVAPVALGLAIWMGDAGRPEVLIAPRGAAIGALGPEGRAVDRPRGSSYPVASWLSADGDAATQEVAATRSGVVREDGRATATLANGWQVVLLRGRVSAAAIAAVCAPRTVVAAWAATQAIEGPCRLLDRVALERLGAVAVRADGDRVAIIGANPPVASRRWGLSMEEAAESED